VDAAFLDLRNDWEMQAYLCIEDLEFELTLMYDPDILTTIGIDKNSSQIGKLSGGMILIDHTIFMHDTKIKWWDHLCWVGWYWLTTKVWNRIHLHLERTCQAHRLS
jgi:hypothetical protein